MIQITDHETETASALECLRQWNLAQRQRQAARRGWIGCLIIAIVLAVLFVITALAGNLKPVNPERGFDWLPWIAWTLVALSAAFLIWQAKACLPVILGHDRHGDLPDDHLPTESL